MTHEQYRERDLPDPVERGLSILHRFVAVACNAFIVAAIVAVVLGIAVAIAARLL